MKAEILEFHTWLSETNHTTLKGRMQSLLEQSGFVIVGFIEYYYEHRGYTAVWLLAESHLAVHTFPEEGKAYLQLSSCNHEKHKRFCHLIGAGL